MLYYYYPSFCVVSTPFLPLQSTYSKRIFTLHEFSLLKVFWLFSEKNTTTSQDVPKQTAVPVLQTSLGCSACHTTLPVCSHQFGRGY